MLVLSRKLNEKIVINDNITLTVLRITGDKVRIGIEADRHIPVHRKEVYDAICQQAAHGAPAARPVSQLPGDDVPRSALVRSVRRTS